MSGVTIFDVNAPTDRSRREPPRVIGGALQLMRSGPSCSRSPRSR